MRRTILLGASRTLALYGFAGWTYIALVALVHPSTLGLRLTHFLSFPHEDTFGEVSFLVSLVSFFVYSLLRTSVDNPPALRDSVDEELRRQGGSRQAPSVGGSTQQEGS